MNPKLASINSSDTTRMISTTFGCMLKGYFSVRGLIWSFRWLRVMGCKAVSQLGRSLSSSAISCGRLSFWISEYLVKSWYSSLNSKKNTCFFSVSSSLVSLDLAGINKLLLYPSQPFPMCTIVSGGLYLPDGYLLDILFSSFPL